MPDYSQVQPLSMLVRSPTMPQPNMNLAAQRTNIEGAKLQQESMRMQQEEARQQQLKEKQIQSLVPFSLKPDGSLDIDSFYSKAAQIDLPTAETYKANYLKREADSMSLSKSQQELQGARLEYINSQLEAKARGVSVLKNLLDKTDEFYKSGDTVAAQATYDYVKKLANGLSWVDASGKEAVGIKLPENYGPDAYPVVDNVLGAIDEVYSKVNPAKETDAQRAARAVEEMMIVLRDPDMPETDKVDAIVKVAVQYPRTWSAISTMVPLALRKEAEKRYRLSEAGALGGTSTATVGPAATKTAVTQSIKLQDSKIASANAAMQILHRDPVTGAFTVPTPQQATELAMACARLVSPTGQVAENLINELQQKTLIEKISRAVAFFGGKTAGTTQQNLENIEAFINREGSLAEKQRNEMAKGNLIHFEPSGPSGAPKGDVRGFVIEEVK